MTDRRTIITVETQSGRYDVTVGAGAIADVGPIARAVAPDPKAMLVVDDGVPASHVQPCQTSLRDSGFVLSSAAITAGEESKTLETLGHLYESMCEAGLERGSPVIALGGGIVGDVAGFAAASWLRGVPLVAVPTTLLAMVDASVGGKTGVNLRLPDGRLAKNQVGAFWQPRAVVADPDVLATLDPRDLRCGLAECVKYALIADASLLELLEAEADALLGGDAGALGALIVRCVRIKADVVAADEREAGRRMWLNLGHTFGHAIEAHRHLGLRHGEAVAVGLAAACEYACRTGRLEEPQRARVEAVLERLGLPARLPEPEPVAQLVDAMRHDKKMAAGRLRLVLPVGLGAVEVVDDVDPDTLRRAWRRVGGAERN